ncbi:UDP-N-acetylglucosamine 1-carboxyvinyltransferase [uncultured Croceicoccus sp.]|uniref:UDP-N-acetylglucosamine 1-carboxyvinyltransferase n=1 Tax=uncultured Croceicoccus sp. TaxID=1295329 RepID=UPI00260F08F3|nr:UDP-N-acetylglucosamine 1-carboxyvinyltransferase [uncultured Croceicoccus sp.]
MDAEIFGGAQPKGRVRVSGAKNSATRLLAAGLLADGPVVLNNFPTKLVDVGHKIEFCRQIGAVIDVSHVDNMVRIDPTGLESRILTREQFDIPIRTTYLLAAAQIMRSGIARIPYPGGCPIGGGAGGGRGYDLHAMVWEKLGCIVTERDDHIEITGKGFRGGEIVFPISTVGGTENALLCASIAEGTTEVLNAYITPEIEDLIKLLRKMGAQIEVYGTSRIVIEGRRVLTVANHTVMADRIEALTWIVYAALSGGTLTIEDVPFGSMEVPLLHLEKAGIDLFRNSNSVHVSPACLTAGAVQPFELACGTHPGVISDMQAFYVLLGVVGAGTSRVFDYRYPERIGFVAELQKLVDRPCLEAKHGAITIRGPAGFSPGEAISTDLRGSMAIVIAALCADGRSVIKNVEMALRGYNDLQTKLRKLGIGFNTFEPATVGS